MTKIQNSKPFADSHRSGQALRLRSGQALRLRSGQVMLEAVVALGILVAGILGIFSVLSNSIAVNRVSANKQIGVNLASEGIEVVKSIIDANYLEGSVAWNAGLICAGGCSVQYDTDRFKIGLLQNNFLKFDPNDPVYNYSVGADTIFKRMIRITPGGTPDEMRVVSTVSWIDRNNIPYSVVLEDRFFNWRK